METGYLNIPDGNVFFRKSGSGKSLIIALHGFGQDGRVFSSFPLPQDYCLYALDLPWHGHTKWQNPTFSPACLSTIVEAVLQLEAGKTHLDLIGFSYGAGLWIGTLPALPMLQYRLFLVSPEAISGRWKRWTNRIPGKLRQWIGYIIQNHPKILLKLATLLEKIHLLHPFALRFLQHHLGDPAKRNRLLNTWINLAHFPIRQSALTMHRDSLSAIYCIIGKHDPLLNLSAIKKWGEQVPGLQLLTLSNGHNLLGKVDWPTLLR